MELELKGIRLDGYDLAVDTTLFTEETLESIVPDACPDILQILSTCGSVYIRSREAKEGRLELRGVACAQVLYIPEGEEHIRRLDISVPFACGLDHSAVHPGCAVHISAGLTGADTRLLNPRKVYVRTELALHVSCYSPYQKKIASGSDHDAQLGVQEKREACRLCVIKTVQSKAFSFSDELSLPSGKPDMQELLSQRVEVFCTETRLIGSKLIFKGQALLSVLYRDMDGLPAAAAFEIPFSQIMEVADAAEEMDHSLDVVLSELTCRPGGEDPRILSVSMSFLAQAVLREKRNIELLSDLYSTVYSSSVEFGKATICRSSSDEIVCQEICETLETAVPVKTVIDLSLSAGSVEQKWEGKTLRTTVAVRIWILYQGEDGEYYPIDRTLPVISQIDADPGCSYTPLCRCGEERSAMPTSGGIEVRGRMDFFFRVERQQEIRTVAGASLEDASACDSAGRPSIVLRMAGIGESLWDIAKLYHTTEQEIMEANDLQEHGTFTGRMLLIPKTR